LRLENIRFWGDCVKLQQKRLFEKQTSKGLEQKDYYPFGMMMPGRKYSSGTQYRYGFNGKEKDNEVVDGGNAIHFEFRDYDPRIGRFKSIDPKSSSYAWQTPYAYHRNNPITSTDHLGLGDPPTTIYHRTSAESASSILSSGFDPAKSARNGFTFFTTTQSGGSIGTSAASGNTVIHASVDLAGAKEVGKAQMSQWFKEGLASANKQMKTNYASMAEIPENLRGKYQSIADGFRYNKLAEFMKADGGGIYKIGGTNTVAVSEASISKVKITGLSGEGAASVLNSTSRAAREGEAVVASSKFAGASKFIKWGGRLLLAVAIAKDVYDIYQAEDKTREIVKKVSFWGGFAAGASTAGGGAAALGIDAGGPVGWGAHALITLGGGLIGGFTAETITEKIYDYFFTKGVSAK
jgi:RHS repeat-associated protein